MSVYPCPSCHCTYPTPERLAAHRRLHIGTPILEPAATGPRWYDPIPREEEVPEEVVPAPVKLRHRRGEGPGGRSWEAIARELAEGGIPCTGTSVRQIATGRYAHPGTPFAERIRSELAQRWPEMKETV